MSKQRRINLELWGPFVAALFSVGCDERLLTTYASIEPSQTKVLLAAGEHTKLTARILDARGKIMPGTLQWTSQNIHVATVESDGLVTAVAPGMTELDVSAKQVSARIQIAVYSMDQLDVAKSDPVTPK